VPTHSSIQVGSRERQHIAAGDGGTAVRRLLRDSAQVQLILVRASAHLQILQDIFHRRERRTQVQALIRGLGTAKRRHRRVPARVGAEHTHVLGQRRTHDKGPSAMGENQHRPNRGARASGRSRQDLGAKLRRMGEVVPATAHVSLQKRERGALRRQAATPAHKCQLMK